MAEGFRFIYLALGLVRCKHECRCSHARGADMSFRDVTIKIPDRDVTRDVSDITHWKRGLRFEKSQFVEFLPVKKKVDCRGSSWPDEFVCYGFLRVSGVESWRCKSSQQRRIEPLSPDVEKPFNSKVIKSFVLERISRKCFYVLGFLCYVYVYYGHCEHSMLHIRIMGMLHYHDTTNHSKNLL